MREVEAWVGEVDAAAIVCLPPWITEPIASLDFDAISERNVAWSMPRHFPSAVDSEEFRSALLAAARDNLSTLREIVCGRAPLESIRPEQGELAASIEAHLDVTNTAMHSGYRLAADLVFWDCLEAIHETLDGGEIDGREIVSGILMLARVFAEWRSRIMDPVSEVHRLEEDKLRRSREQLRRNAVLALLRGEPVDGLLDLRYDVNATHIAVHFPDCREARALPMVNAVHQAIAAADRLVIATSVSSITAWFATNSRLRPTWREAVRSSLRRFETPASVSEPSPGLPGIRAAFENTTCAERLRGWATPTDRVLLYHDIRLECMLLSDPAAARSFVVAELGDLQGSAIGKKVLRETAAVFLDKGSVVATAAELVLHEHTVRNRLRRVEEYLGHPLTTRRAEVHVALRIHDFAAAAGDSP